MMGTLVNRSPVTAHALCDSYVLNVTRPFDVLRGPYPRFSGIQNNALRNVYFAAISLLISTLSFVSPQEFLMRAAGFHGGRNKPHWQTLTING
jgi:hypothetical protein